MANASPAVTTELLDAFADGSRVEVAGCDLFTFVDGRIAVKDSYRKNRPAMVVPAR